MNPTSKIARRLSLRKRILVPLCLAAAGLLMALSIALHEFEQRQMLKQVELRAQLTANALSYAAETVTDEINLRRFVSAIGSQSEIDFIHIFRSDTGAIIASTQHQNRGKAIFEAAASYLPQNHLNQRDVRLGSLYRKGQTFAYLEEIPLGRFYTNGIGSQPGQALIGLNSQAFSSHLQKSSQTYALFSLSIALILTVIAYALLESRIIRPLASISDAIEERETTGRSLRIPLLEGDEIGYLAASLQLAFDQLERQFKKSKQLTKNLQIQEMAVNAHNILSQTDAAGKITHVNEAFLEVSKYSREELVGQNHRLINSGLHSRDFWANMYRTVKEKGVWRGDIRNRAKDGSFYWVDSTIFAVRDENGKIERYLSVRTDISAKKKVEFELSHAKADIELNLTAAQQARAQAEQAAQAKSRFLATMSHEIRTPMNGLIGVLHLLEDGLPAEKSNLLQTAKKSADDLLMLINDILDLSKIEAGKMELDPSPFDPLELVEDVCILHAPIAHQKGVELVCLPPIEPQRIIGDPLRVRQILSNLLSNAVKFTSRGEISVRARVLEKAMRIEVKDSGIGIDASAQGKLFESFSQENSSTTRQFGGTGLGLSICKRLVEMMNGKIGMESEKGRGSLFWFELPLDASWEQNAPEPGLFHRPLDGKLALIVDPHPLRRENLKQGLEKWGCQVQELATREALPSLPRPEPDFDILALVPERADDDLPLWLAKQKPNLPCLENATIVLLLPRSVGQSQPPKPPGAEIVHMPIRSAELLEALIHEARPIKTPRSPDHSQFAGLRLLLVDDNRTNRFVTSKLLEQRHGIEGDTAANGIEALQALANKAYDIVLMDCMMPEMDGYEATRALRNNPNSPNRDTPIIALTANAMQGDREDCCAAGMSDYLTKPIEPHDLVRILNQWASKRHIHDETSTPLASESASGGALDPEILNVSKLDLIYDGEIEIINEMIGLFIEGLVESMHSLRESVETGDDIDKIRFFAHRVKGSAAEFGAARLAEMANKMEERCIDKALSEAILLFEATEKEAQLVYEQARLRTGSS